MRSENLLFSVEPRADLQSFLNTKGYSKVVALTDENTSTHCLGYFGKGIFDEAIEVSSGEEHKNIKTCEVIWNRMTALALDRHSVLVVIGGGVLGDMGGFCAATYKRGIDFIFVPTTLLAQVDSSIGGKLGVDFQNFKNHIGVFQRPVLNLINSEFLKTLPREELRSGFAEVIKHCLISDRNMWEVVSSRTLENQEWQTLARHSADFKAHITDVDPTEKGRRKILNAGHTIGHALESQLLSTGNRILHGEAIAVGLIAEAFLSYKRSRLSREELHAVSSYIIKIFGKISLSEEQMAGSCQLAIQDKKNRGNKILCVLLDGIGHAVWDQEITTEEIRSALAYYSSL